MAERTTAPLGDLERSVMDLLWDSPAGLSATGLRDALAAGGARELAVTTVLTVLTRLERKEFVTRDRDTRPHLYSAVSARADYMAELMHDVLGTAPDREAVLTRFLGQVGASELELLKRVIADTE